MIDTNDLGALREAMDFAMRAFTTDATDSLKHYGLFAALAREQIKRLENPYRGDMYDDGFADGIRHARDLLATEYDAMRVTEPRQAGSDPGQGEGRTQVDKVAGPSLPASSAGAGNSVTADYDDLKPELARMIAEFLFVKVHPTETQARHDGLSQPPECHDPAPKQGIAGFRAVGDTEQHWTP